MAKLSNIDIEDAGTRPPFVQIGFRSIKRAVECWRPSKTPVMLGGRSLLERHIGRATWWRSTVIEFVSRTHVADGRICVLRSHMYIWRAPAFQAGESVSRSFCLDRPRGSGSMDLP